MYGTQGSDGSFACGGARARSDLALVRCSLLSRYKHPGKTESSSTWLLLKLRRRLIGVLEAMLEATSRRQRSFSTLLLPTPRR